MEAVSDRSEENRETEFAAPSAGEKTESAVSDEPITDPSVSAQPTTATNALPETAADEADCQRPVVDPPILDSLEEKSEPGLPVEAAAETPLALSGTNQRRPRVDLLEHQLVRSVTRNYPHETASKLRKGTVDLYSSLTPRDAIDSMLAGAIVGLSNATMDCFDRATLSEKTRELNLRYGIKGAATLADLGKLYDSRRGQGGQTVTVGKVNVEAGGQAIVGNVKTAARRTRQTGSESVPRKPTKKER